MYQCPLCSHDMPENEKGRHEGFECPVLLELNAEEELCEYCDLSLPLYLLQEHIELIHHEGLFENDARDENIILSEVAKIESNVAKEIVPEKLPSVAADIIPSPPAGNNANIKPVFLEEIIQKKSPATVSSISETQPKVIKETVKQSKVTNTTTENKQTEFKFRTQAEEYTTKTGEKLLVYGTDMDPVEDLETEKESYRSNNPLLNSGTEENTTAEDIEDINNLSDDDSEESLEEFWKRAREYLKRNRGKVEC